MNISPAKLRELLVGPGYVSAADFKDAAAEALAAKKDLTDILLNKDLIQDDQLGQLIADDAGFKFSNLRREKIDMEVFNSVPEIVARQQGVIAFARTTEGIRVGMLSPDNLELRYLLEKRLGDKIIPSYVTRQDFEDILFKYRSPLSDEFKNILKLLKDKNRRREEKDQLIVAMVDTLLSYGYQNNASDVHIEPYEKKIAVRFRIDGVMHDVLDAPKELMDFIVTRIKILAKMRTDEHQAAQDGKFRYNAGTEVFDVRASVLPVNNGENVVMRLLSAKNRQFSLTDLGLTDRDLKKVRRMIDYPHGMILATGPTGSGKTTTLYAVLKILNKREIHISTIEDPIEYNIEGISQIQVNSKTNLTFANGLRSILRQDPDVIMIGEIRDEETADIAVNSALTGHLVLSTLHTNDAASSIPRLLDMKIQPFLAASTINLIIAQRLVRKICERCRVSYVLSADEIDLLKSDSRLTEIFKAQGYKDFNKVRLYKGEGCKVCGNTGYVGRIGIFEVLEITEAIKDLISRQAPSEEIYKVARAAGMTTMLEDGLDKVFRGLVTLEEVAHAVKE